MSAFILNAVFTCPDCGATLDFTVPEEGKPILVHPRIRRWPLPYQRDPCPHAGRKFELMTVALKPIDS